MALGGQVSTVSISKIKQALLNCLDYSRQFQLPTAQ